MIYKETALTPEILATLENNETYLCIVQSWDEQLSEDDLMPESQLWLKWKKDKQLFIDMRQELYHEQPLEWKDEVVRILLTVNPPSKEEIEKKAELENADNPEIFNNGFVLGYTQALKDIGFYMEEGK
jgi:hypothetical protein